jgi:UDP:flavonoid glycosyltransferase YjiC (YdhE family)
MLPIAINHKMTSMCPSLPELDFPFPILPPRCHGVGPMILPARSVTEVDTELAKWLSRRPTILVNLGTHHTSGADSARAMARTLATILAEKDVQVLWELKYDYSHDSLFMQPVQPALSQDRIRIMPWIGPETSAILSHADIVASVHHGGLNSYYEACYAGVPQIVLPAWFDCYQTGPKAEYLGIGVCGNRESAPEVGERGFLEALQKVVDDQEMRARAEKLGKMCRSRRSGREKACDVIAEVAMQQEKKEKKQGRGARSCHSVAWFYLGSPNMLRLEQGAFGKISGSRCHNGQM